MRSECTCAGPAPGYPQHETYCGQPESDVDLSKWVYDSSGYVHAEGDKCTCTPRTGVIKIYWHQFGCEFWQPIGQAINVTDAKIFVNAHNDLVDEILALSSRVSA